MESATLKDTAVAEATSPALEEFEPHQHSRGVPKLIWLTIGLGIVLRLVQYLLNRSLWLDESHLALNIINRSYAGLLQPLDDHQGAPVGILMLEKLATRWFGASEYALRLLPLIAGLLSLFLFYKVARESIRQRAVPIAMGLFAISIPLIYYSSEVKQYSTDVVFALLIYSVALVGKPAEWSAARMTALALLGAVAIWASHPSVFVLAGVGLTAATVFLVRRQWDALARFSLVALAWMTSLGLSYFFFLRALTRDQDLLNYWAGNFMPLPPKSVSDLKWFVDSLFGFFSQTAGMEMGGVAALCFITGTVYMYQRSREKLSFLLTPVPLTMVASAMHKYPFGGRLILFLLPAVLLVLSEGAEQILGVTRRNGAAVVGYTLIAFLFLDPSLYLAHHYAKPHAVIQRAGIMPPEEIKPVMAYVLAHESQVDVVYLFSGSQSAYKYYDELYGTHQNNLILGANLGDAQEYVADLNRLRGRRAWVVLSHFSGEGADQSKYIEFYLNVIGKRIDQFTAAGAKVDLYDLRAASPGAGRTEIPSLNE
jgi:uncharacterized membrane protein